MLASLMRTDLGDLSMSLRKHLHVGGVLATLAYALTMDATMRQSCAPGTTMGFVGVAFAIAALAFAVLGSISSIVTDRRASRPSLDIALRTVGRTACWSALFVAGFYIVAIDGFAHCYQF